MTIPWRPLGLLAFAAALFLVAAGALRPLASAAASKASPTPSPTAVPTPFMALDLIPNGTWMIVLESNDIVYSSMKLKAAGTSISGKWDVDKKTSYFVTGTRDGSHLKLDLRLDDKPDSKSIGTIDATLDGIADMFGTITLNGKDTPFQGAQHSRVPAPVDTGGPAAGPTPYH